MGCRGRKRKMLSVLPEQRKAAFPKKSGQRFSSLLVCYFRLVKTTTPAMVRTALNSTEKSIERLISISPMRHNCPNTMRKPASDGVKRKSPLSCNGPNFHIGAVFSFLNPACQRWLRGLGPSDDATQQRPERIVLEAERECRHLGRSMTSSIAEGLRMERKERQRTPLAGRPPQALRR